MLKIKRPSRFLWENLRSLGIIMMFLVFLSSTVFADIDWAKVSKAELKENLEAPFEPPQWLSSTTSVFPDYVLTEIDRWGLTLFRKLHGLEANETKFKDLVKSIHRAIELNQEPDSDRGKLIFTLAVYYENMFEDYIRSYQLYKKAYELSKTVPQIHDAQNHNMRSLENMAVLGVARSLTKLDLKDDAQNLLREYEPSFSDWRDLLDLAIIYKFLRDINHSNDILVRVISTSKGIYAVAPIGRAIILLYKNGMVKLVEQYISKYEEAYAVAPTEIKQIGSNVNGHEVLIKDILRLIREDSTIDFSHLRDGSYSGRSMGFYSPIEVEVQVKNGKVREIIIKEKNETRCFNAFSFIPRAIIKEQKLEVDAVTQATVSSEQLVNAIRVALKKAEK